MYTLYKDGDEVGVDREQVPIMLEAGWSITKKEAAPPEIKTPKESSPESQPPTQGEPATGEEKQSRRKAKE